MSFEADLKKALLLVREFTLKAHIQQIDPRATRVAIKVLMLIDTHFANQNLTQEEERGLTEMAVKVFKMGKEGFEEETRRWAKNQLA